MEPEIQAEEVNRLLNLHKNAAQAFVENYVSNFLEGGEVGLNADTLELMAFDYLREMTPVELLNALEPYFENDL